MKTKVESTINIHFDNCCGEPMTLTHSEAIELYHQLGASLNYPTKKVLPPSYNDIVLCGGVTTGFNGTNTVSGVTAK